jgi:hypothetical protein
MATMVTRTRLNINIFDTEFHAVTSLTTTGRNYIRLKYEEIITADYFLKETRSVNMWNILILDKGVCINIVYGRLIYDNVT